MLYIKSVIPVVMTRKLKEIHDQEHSKIAHNLLLFVISVQLISLILYNMTYLITYI